MSDKDIRARHADLSEHVRSTDERLARIEDKVAKIEELAAAIASEVKPVVDKLSKSPLVRMITGGKVG